VHDAGRLSAQGSNRHAHLALGSTRSASNVPHLP
jgi:hypothetical protein